MFTDQENISHRSDLLIQASSITFLYFQSIWQRQKQAIQLEEVCFDIKRERQSWKSITVLRGFT